MASTWASSETSAAMAHPPAADRRDRRKGLLGRGEVAIDHRDNRAAGGEG
jgi:hypothetical protein